KQQQSQVITPQTQAKVAQENVQTQTQEQNIVKELQQEVSSSQRKLNSSKDVETLVKELNKALQPMNTNLKFGVDSQDIFYVSVIDAQTSKMIRRFPAEQAQDFLPKMQEVTGILFDSKG
ncbi:MAG: flagellar protein FlaG, partial [Sulfurimonas sp.]|nr:flagellar protein FlaG [Sulfurimonas sp.]